MKNIYFLSTVRNPTVSQSIAMVNTDFEKIYLNQSRFGGRMRIADSGLGWKILNSNVNGNALNAVPFLLPLEEISTAGWSRGSRGYELRVQTKNQGVVSLDGFDIEDFNKLKQELTRNFHVTLEHKEHSLRGWNWGKTDLARNELIFQVNNKPSFEIPYSDITNSNLTGKNEVSIEFNLDKASSEQNNYGGASTGDEVVEMRFYVPGTIENETTKTVKDETNGEIKEEEELEELSAATVFYEQLKDKASIGQIAGEAIVSFSDILFLTPRGRYDIDMYPNSLRLRGKTYDYKIQYKQIERIFSLPKPDDTHHLIILQIDPPLRQGQTRYPFLSLQFQREEEIELELNVSNEEYESKYKTRLQKNYDANTFQVMSECFKGLTERRLIEPGSFISHYGLSAISCSLKASEGLLYPLERCFIFVTKPTIYIPFSEISNVTMSRTGGGVSASRTFDLEINLRGSNNQSHIFGSINRDEQESIENFCQDKGIRVKNEEKLAKAMLAKAIAEENDDDDDDADVDMGSAGEEDLEDDNDFQSGSDSDIAEEFDSDADSTGSEAEGGDEPPKKKLKS